MNECNDNEIKDLKEIAIQGLKKISGATNNATGLQQYEKIRATNTSIIEDQKLIEWFLENYGKLPVIVDSLIDPLVLFLFFAYILFPPKIKSSFSEFFIRSRLWFSLI